MSPKIDFVKMRSDIYRDPKVIQMSRYLVAKSNVTRNVTDNALRNVTETLRSVMRNAVVGALVSLWGVVRHQAKLDEGTGDAILPGVGCDVIDEITDLEGLGEAMAEVGWVRQEPGVLIFPKFFVGNNIDPLDAAKEANARRQKRWREKHKSSVTIPENGEKENGVDKSEENNVTRNVTVTLRNAPRREEFLNTNTNAGASADQKKEEKLPGERKEEKTEESENQTQPAQPAESAKPSGLSPQAIYDLVGSVADVVAGKKTGDAIRRGESSVLNPDVPPPPPVRPRGYHPSDYPEEFPKAKRIAKLYDQEVGSEYGSASGIPEIIRRIVEGETVEALEQTVRNAGAHFKKLETPKDRRPGAKSFFAPGGRYDDYRDAHLGKEKPVPEWVVRKMKSDALEALEKKRREEEEACIAQCAAEGLCPPREHLKTLKTSWERMRMKADVYAPLILERLGEFKPQV